MSSGLVSYLAWWGSYAVGILAMAYSVILRLREPNDERGESDRGGVFASVAMIAGLLLLGLILIGLYAQPGNVSWSFGAVLFIGGTLAIVVSLFPAGGPSQASEQRPTPTSA